MTLKGKCPSCGYHCAGWALSNPKHRLCPNCGARMQVTNDSGKVGGLATRLRSLMPAVLKNHLSNNKAPTSGSVNNSQEREPG